MRETPEYLEWSERPHRAQERRVIAAGRPGLRFRFYPGVSEDVRRELKRFADWLRQRIRFRHPVRVTVVPQPTVMGHEGPAGWGVFLIPPEDYALGDVVRIYVGGGAVDLVERRFGFTRAEALAKLKHDVAHEVVHYEQWRDGREVCERGVNRRAASLVSQYLHWRGPRSRMRSGT